MNSKDTSVYGSHTNSHWRFFGYKPQSFPTETDKSVKLLKQGCWAFSFSPSFAFVIDADCKISRATFSFDLYIDYTLTIFILKTSY